MIGTGNTPLAGVQALSPRDYFFDAPLIDLSDTYNATISPIASTDYEVAVGWSGVGNISDAQLGNITKFVNDAHSRGIQVRLVNSNRVFKARKHSIGAFLGHSGLADKCEDERLAGIVGK